MILDQIESKIRQMDHNDDEYMNDDVETVADSLDEFDTFYHDIYSLEDYRNLEKMLQTMPEISS